MPDQLEPGDILLGHRRASSGATDWLTSKIVELAQGTPYGHAAMYVGNGEIVHAHRSIPKPGVTKLPLESFKKLYDFKAYRVDEDQKVRQNAADFVRSAIGRSYSVPKMLGSLFAEGPESKRERLAAQLRPEYMCSELIAAAYPSKTFAGRSTSTTKPVDLARSTNTKLVQEHRMEKGAAKGNKSADPDSVKRKTDFQGIPIHIDRPKGFTMHGQNEKGVPWTRIYHYDYGFIPKTTGGDGDGLDVFLGPDPDAHESFWAVQNKPDGSFDEYKVFLGFKNRDEATAAYRQHIPLRLLRGMVAVKVDMMKAMLGIDAEGYHHNRTEKVAEFLGFASCM